MSNKNWRGLGHLTGHSKLSKEVEAFLHALRLLPEKLHNTQIIVLALGDLEKDHHFLEVLNEQKDDPRNPPAVQNLITFDLRDKLQGEDFLILDTHLNKRGNEVVAQEIIKILEGQ